jgi:hypothetical protein
VSYQDSKLSDLVRLFNFPMIDDVRASEIGPFHRYCSGVSLGSMTAPGSRAMTELNRLAFANRQCEGACSRVAPLQATESDPGHAMGLILECIESRYRLTLCARHRFERCD